MSRLGPLLAVVLFVLSTQSAGRGGEPDSPPNVVLVMTDDQGYGDLGCHGNPVIKTPNLDALYAESVRLTNFHVDPTCSPTRAALMTGRYSSRTGVWHTIMGRSILHKDEVTMADVFAANGYRCGIFGKWHLGDNYPYRPQDRGFHEVLIHGGGGIGQTPDFWGNDYFDDTYIQNGKPTPPSPPLAKGGLGGGGNPKKFTGYCTDVFFDVALDFIEQNRDRPFLCYIPTNAAHGPFHVAEKYSQPYKEAGVPSPRAEFYGMITNIDENVARLRKRLKSLGLEQNTILVFTTDNGTAAGYGQRGRSRNPASPRSRVSTEGFNAGMRGTKGSEYDGGHRVPCFVRWPKGGLLDGRDVEPITAHIDLLPTLIDLCGLRKPENVEFDGRSLVPHLSKSRPPDGTSKRNTLEPPSRSRRAGGTYTTERTQEPWPQRTLFVHSQRVEHPRKWRKFAVMTDRWRLVGNGDRRELFDMNDDPGQRQNVAEKFPDVFARLSGEYENWYADVGERFDGYVRIPLGAPAARSVQLSCHDWHTNNGPVPWNQNHIRRDLQANGFWAVEVVRDGTYKITLRTRPAHIEHSLSAEQARVRIGDVETSRHVESDATQVTFTVDLPSGPSRLQTWLIDADGNARGAYFVDVRFVNP